MARPRISGLKYRQALSLLVLRDWSWDGLNSLTRALSLAVVNLPFLLAQAGGEGMTACLCLEQERRRVAEDAAVALAGWCGWAAPEIHEPVATISLYPLAGGLTLPAEALLCLAEAGLRPLAMGTSLASLMLVMPEGTLPKALEAFRHRFQPPPGSSPPQERVKVVQSALWRKR